MCLSAFAARSAFWAESKHSMSDAAGSASCARPGVISGTLRAKPSAPFIVTQASPGCPCQGSTAALPAFMREKESRNPVQFSDDFPFLGLRNTVFCISIRTQGHLESETFTEVEYRTPVPSTSPAKLL